MVFFLYLNSWIVCFCFCFIPICSFCSDVCLNSQNISQCYLSYPSVCCCTRLPVFPHMFCAWGWSVRITLFIFEWQCVMSNRWWCTKTANPEAWGNSLMWRNLKVKGQQPGTQSDPSLSLHAIIQKLGGVEAEIQGTRQGSDWATELRCMLSPQWVVYSYPLLTTTSHPNSTNTGL